MECYKKIDKSFFKYGITIPVDHVLSFTNENILSPGSSMDVSVVWKNKKYAAKIYNVNRRGASPVHQLRWDNNQELLRELKYEFIQSYFAIESQILDKADTEEKFMTKLLGGNQEVVIFNPSNGLITMKTFIKITTSYDNIFKRLIENNVFGWLSSLGEDHMITKRTNWFSITDIKKYENEPYVIYYLVDEKKKEIYIGSAKRLGDRVKPGRVEIPGWNKFRFEIVHPSFHENLREIEYHAIMAFARFFINKGNLSSLEVSNYSLVNKDYKYYTN
jgi:hypothetical protein